MNGFQLTRGWIILGSVVLAFLLFILVLAGSYNKLVRMDQGVQNSWAQVEVQYQRRSDLVPQLVDTVSGIAAQERAVLIGVTEARAKVSQINVDLDEVPSAAQIQEFAAAQGELGSALSRLLVTVEAYPEVASQENFLALQAQIEGTENRIAVARRDYNQTVTDWNSHIKAFPRVLWANLFGFEDYERFEADEGAEDAPEIDFEIEGG